MRRRMLTAGGVIALLLATITFTPQSTLAGWNDVENGTASLTATTVQAPTTIGCSITNGLGLIFASVTLTWKFPAGTSYTAANAVLGAASTANGLTPSTPQPTVTGPDGSGTYSATYTRAALTSILGGVNGTTFWIGAQTNLNTWTTAWMPASVTVGALGLGSTCTPG